MTNTCTYKTMGSPKGKHGICYHIPDEECSPVLARASPTGQSLRKYRRFTDTNSNSNNVFSLKSIRDNIGLFALPAMLRSDGGLSVELRGFIVRLVFMQIAISGVVCFVIALTHDAPNTVTFSCALAASVNIIACLHYKRIWEIRSEAPSPAGIQMQNGQASEQEKDANTVQKQKEHKYAQETVVDGLRYGDWMVTLVIMTLDLYTLQEYATGGRFHSPIHKYVSAALMPFMVLFGAVYRFYINEFRPDAEQRSISFVQYVIGVCSFITSCTLLSIGVWGIVQPIHVAMDDTTHVFTDSQRSDANAVLFLTYIWIGYPVVSMMSLLMQYATNTHSGYEYSQWISVFKDVFYGALDVTSKGGLAMYVAYRSTWIRES